MGGKSVMILVLAVVCGLVAMYGATQLLGGKDRPVEMRDVLVAARDLKVEEVITPDMLTKVKMPVTGVPEGAFSNEKDLEGRWVQIPMLQNEPVIAGKLAAKDSPPGLIGRIPQGKRAFSIEVTEESGVSGFVLPDHRVDVIQVSEENSDPRRRKPAKIILQNVLVLAAGQVFTRPEDKSINVRTVTLAVSPVEAEVLVAARSKGPLSLALRGLHDEQIVEQTVEPEEPALVMVTPPIVAPTPTPPPVLPPAIEPEPVVRKRPVRSVVIHHGVHQTELVRTRVEEQELSNAGKPVLADEPSNQTARQTANLPPRAAGQPGAGERGTEVRPEIPVAADWVRASLGQTASRLLGFGSARPARAATAAHASPAEVPSGGGL